jgi:hypothetical protein
MRNRRREKFLEKYLKLFGVSKLDFKLIAHDKICGRAFFLDNEYQDFCWIMNEEKVPKDNVLELIKQLKDNDLINIDKLTGTPELLFTMTKQNDYEDFISTFYELMSIHVQMIDNGKETDSFFIHK